LIAISKTPERSPMLYRRRAVFTEGKGRVLNQHPPEDAAID
jgi:hypothetical protein